ncbi:hypothetical protein OAJ88_02970 [Candidatus Nitrosopelagicus sp.]|nr:hypothetical protein [Candidatus Nitrosopelagicus sp.]
MAQKLQCPSRGVDVLTGRWDKKRKEQKHLEMFLKEKRKTLDFLVFQLKEKESTAYLEKSQCDIKRLKDEIQFVQEEINVIAQKRWGRKPELSDDEKEKFK